MPITRMPLYSHQKHNVTTKLAFLGLFLFFCLIQKHNPSHFEKEEQAGEPRLTKSQIVIQLSLNWDVFPCSALIGTTGAQLAQPPNKLFFSLHLHWCWHLDRWGQQASPEAELVFEMPRQCPCTYWGTSEAEIWMAPTLKCHCEACKRSKSGSDSQDQAGSRL